MIVVDLLTVVLGKCFEAFTTEKEDSNLGELFAGRDIAGFLEKLLKLFLPSTK
jgi:hypothetical protein